MAIQARAGSLTEAELASVELPGDTGSGDNVQNIYRNPEYEYLKRMGPRYYSGYLEVNDDMHGCAPGFRDGSFYFQTPYYWSARKGDLVLSRNSEGMVASVLDAIDQKFTHVGLAQGPFSVTHNYANTSDLFKAIVGTSPENTHIDPYTLRHAGPGVRTESLRKALEGENPWFISDTLLVLRSAPDLRSKVEEAAKEALRVGQWPGGTPSYNFPGFSFGAYGNGNSICSVFARDANIRAGNSFEKVSSETWQERVAKLLEAQKLLNKENDSKIEFDSDAIERHKDFIRRFSSEKVAFPYSKEDRSKGGKALYEAISDDIETDIAEQVEAEYDWHAHNFGFPLYGLVGLVELYSLGFDWEYDEVDIVRENLANQVVNCFLHGVIRHLV